MNQSAPIALSAIPLTATAILVIAVAFHVRCAWKSHDKKCAGDVLWAILSAAIMLFIGVWTWLGYVDPSVGTLDLAAISILLLLCGMGTMLRRPLRLWVNSMPRLRGTLFRIAVDIVILLIVAIASTVSIDLAWLGFDYGVGGIYVNATILILFVVEIALFFLGLQTGVLVSLVPIAAVGFGAAQHFVMLFKGTVVLPSDLLVLGTAAEVSSGYTFMLTQWIVYALGILGACLLLLSLVQPLTAQVKGSAARVRVVAVNLAVSAMLSLGIFSLYGNVKLEEALDTPLNRWMPSDTYQTEGFVLGFLSMAQDLAIPIPEDYSDGDAERLQASLAETFDATLGSESGRAAAVAQFDSKRPSVIAVMNESFADLSLHQAIKDEGYSGPTFYNSLPNTLQRGTFMTSVVGGATANTEFEFLTGASTAFLGSYKYPYQLYDFSHVDSLPKQLASLGYDTVAMHPMDGANYNRTTNYERLGFDEFLDIDDFGGEPTYHSGATDRSTYDKILGLLREREAPQFVFDVTMQNHGGYAAGTVPEEDMVDYAPDSLDEELSTQLNTYLACIEASDRDLRYFIDELGKLDRPVVLVFFGDHQPNISAWLNDALYEGEDAFLHEIRTYEATYFVWANYEIEATSEPAPAVETSASQLASQLMYVIGAPLNDYQKAQMVLTSDVPSVNFLGYRGADGMRYQLTEDSPYKRSLDSLQTIQYMHFARKVL